MIESFWGITQLEFLDQLERVRARPRRWSGTISGDSRAPEFSGSMLDIVVAVAIDESSATTFGLDVFTGEDQATHIGYDVHAQELFVDRTDSGSTSVSSTFPTRHAATHVPSGDVLRMRVLLDRCCVEVFGDHGQAVLTDLVFPSDGNRVRPFVTDGSARVPSLEVFDIDVRQGP